MEKETGHGETTDKIVEGKLTKLLDPTFGSFAVRFCNEEEYRKSISHGAFSGEINVFGTNNPRYKNFADFLAAGRRGWPWLMYALTDWDMSILQATDHTSLLKILWKSHEEALKTCQNAVDLQYIEERTMHHFRSALREYLSSGGFPYQESFHDSWRKKTESDRRFPHSLEETRTMLASIARSESGTSSFPGTLPYHVALIFDHQSVTEGDSNWQYIRSKKRPNFNPPEHLLGAVAVLSDKDIVQNLIETAANAGEWSHPVFDKNGTLRFPRDKS